MGSATRTALAGAREVLAATPGLDRAAGEQLLAAARLIGSSHGLQSALSAADGTAATAMRDRVFAELGVPARAVLEAALSASWSSPAELIAGIEELGIRAIALSSDDADAVARELDGVGQLVAGSAELELALSGTRGTPAARGALVESLLAGRASGEATTIMSHLVRQPRGRRVGELVRTGAELVADAVGKGFATITVAATLSDAQLANVAETVRERYGREHLLVQVVDPAILGGARIQVGHEVIDGSIAARLTDLTLQLAR
ncbi:F0F1 ATP synthase subunit delta [Microcella alkaliphila]|uniref:ATP synthase subunit delta n=1 Tax=Microcella alkaliphila TaxID=279828 RepID=A0A0U4WYJ6_9MICO|nr:F0F1 ATP synthase subunit delta [Microcella alkaliphila]BAU32696.1 ATP synthase subunit delta [Microcella alkaliphila]